MIRNQLTDKSHEYLSVEDALARNNNVFITGAGGTGKSFLINQLRKDSTYFSDNCFFTGSTGISASNINGSTIHSLLGIYPNQNIHQTLTTSGKAINRNDIDSNSIIVLDEISMVSNKLLDTINFVLQTHLQENRIFGGVRFVFVGDFLQLQPVFKKDECYVLPDDEYNRYSNVDKIKIDSCLFSETWRLANVKTIHLTEKKRFLEDNKEFIDKLDDVRKGEYDIQYWQQFKKTQRNEKYILLSSTNDIAKEENNKKLSELDGEQHKYSIDISPPKIRPTKEKDLMAYKTITSNYAKYDNLVLKKGAKVILCVNFDVNKGLYNGRQGVVVDFKNDNPVILFDNNIKITISKYNTTYSIQSKKRRKKHTFTYNISFIPLRLGWAISIHSSQGLTLDGVSLYAKNIFAKGQLYTALSRVKDCKNLEILSFPTHFVAPDKRIVGFYNHSQPVES